ncbi:hypothetical protein KCU83_g270, partial [Aureobasidium melanogenum]
MVDVPDLTQHLYIVGNPGQPWSLGIGRVCKNKRQAHGCRAGWAKCHLSKCSRMTSDFMVSKSSKSPKSGRRRKRMITGHILLDIVQSCVKDSSLDGSFGAPHHVQGVINMDLRFVVYISGMDE